MADIKPFGHGSELPVGIFREINGRHQADGNGHQHGDHGDEHGAGEDRNRPEGPGRSGLILAYGHLRTPVQAEEEVGYRHRLEKADCFEEHRENNADGGQDGDCRTAEKKIGDDFLDGVARLHDRRDFPVGRDDAECGDRNQHEADDHPEALLQPEIGIGRLTDGNIAGGGDEIAGDDVFDIVYHQRHFRGGDIAQLQRQTLRHHRGDDGGLQHLPEAVENEGGNGAPYGRIDPVVSGKRMQSLPPAVASGRGAGAVHAKVIGDNGENQQKGKKIGVDHRCAVRVDCASISCCL